MDTILEIYSIEDFGKLEGYFNMFGYHDAKKHLSKLKEMLELSNPNGSFGMRDIEYYNIEEAYNVVVQTAEYGDDVLVEIFADEDDDVFVSLSY